MTTKKKSTKKTTKKAAKRVAKKGTKEVTVKAKKKTTKKKATKKVAKSKKVKKNSSLPAFNPKKHIKMTDIAKECDMAYASMFAKQDRLGIKSQPVSEEGKKIIVFTLAQAKEIKERTAKKMPKKRLTMEDLQKKLKIGKATLTRALDRCNISPIKYRREEGNRAVSTVAEQSLSRIKKAVQELATAA